MVQRFLHFSSIAYSAARCSMRVLVTGASGLIGSALVARLVAEGHRVVAIARHIARPARSLPAAQWMALDMAAATGPEHWLPHLAEVDAVVNCAGVLQDGPGDSTRGVHVAGTGALFAACQEAGVRRVVQISAIGVDRETPSAFSRTKLEGDRTLMRHDLDWVILRPSVVLGPAAYGGSALFRGLAALPWLPVMPDTGPLQVVQLDEVVAAILFFLAPGAPSRITLDLVGPERLSFADVVRHYRRWLGWNEPRLVRLPGWVAAPLYRLGDIAGFLGWRPPLRTTTRAEIARGAVGDPALWTGVTCIVPKTLAAALTAQPASVQERWFAGLYVLKPVVFIVLSLFWIVTGLVSLAPGYGSGARLMREASAGALSGPSVIAGGLLDVAIGIGIAWRRTTRRAFYAGLALSGFYMIAGSALLPLLWIAPLGPLVKIWPIVALMLAALAILEDR